MNRQHAAQLLEPVAEEQINTKKTLALIGRVYKVENDEQLRRLDLVPGNSLSKASGYVRKRNSEPIR